MNGAELLRRALVAGDFCDETVSAALDALRADEGLSYMQAVLAVAYINREWWAERNLRVAATLLADPSPVRLAMNALILQALQDYAYDSIQVYVVRGEDRPTWLRDSEWSPTGQLSRSVQVGALWLIENSAELELSPEQDEWLQTALRS